MYSRRQFYIVWLIVFTSFAYSSLAQAQSEVLGLPSYPTKVTSLYKESSHINDAPQDIAVFLTTDSLRTVLGYYHKALTKKGYVVVNHMFGPKTGYVGYFDDQSGTMRVVTAVERVDGRTMMVYSSMDPLPLLTKSTKLPNDLPIVDNASNIIVTGSQESYKHRTVAFTVSGADEEDTKKQLLDSARKLGWMFTDQEGNTDSRKFSLKRGKQTLIVNVDSVQNQEDQKPSASVTMVVFER